MSIEGLKMCKIQSLRLSVNEQLTLVGDEIWSVMEKHHGGGPAGGQGPGGGGGGGVGAGAGLLGPGGTGTGTTGVSVRLFVSERLSAAAEIIVGLVQREMDVYEAQLLDIVVKPHTNKIHRPDLQFQLPPYGGSGDQSQQLHQNHGGAAPPPGGDALSSSSCAVGQSGDGQGGLAKRTYKRTRGRGQRPNHSCLLCKKAFRHKTNLVKHAADTHMDNAGCVCGVCGDTPDGREALAEHMESHRADGSGAGGTCAICGKSFQNMETHMRRHTGVKPYSCPVCYKRFPRPGALRRHKKIHARDPRVCYVCGEMFRGEEELQAHIKDTHKGEDHCEDDEDEEEEGGWKEGGEPSDQDREPGIGNYYCRVCGDTFYSKGFLRKHALSHCKEAQCACGVCGEWFESGEALTTHLRSHREPSGPCKICGKVFQNMETHMRRHTGEKPYSCSICHKRFPRPGALRRHKKTHVAERAAHASTSQAKMGGLKAHLGGHPSWGGDDRDDMDKDGDGGDSVLKNPFIPDESFDMESLHQEYQRPPLDPPMEIYPSVYKGDGLVPPINEGQHYRCTFCGKVGNYARIVAHLQTHRRSAVKHGEYRMYRCFGECMKSPHFHCCYCGEGRSQPVILKHVHTCPEGPGAASSNDDDRPAPTQGQPGASAVALPESTATQPHSHGDTKSSEIEISFIPEESSDMESVPQLCRIRHLDPPMEIYPTVYKGDGLVAPVRDGLNYKCVFCGKLGTYGPIVAHLQTHRRRAMKHGDYRMYRCFRECKKSPHYHCCYCGQSRSQPAILKHIQKCTGLATSFSPDHDPSAPRQGEASVPPTLTASQGPVKAHPTVYKGDALVPPIREGSDYQCIFCGKVAEYGPIIAHLQKHRRTAIKHGEYRMYRCFAECMKTPHFHCCYCGVGRSQPAILKHVQKCTGPMEVSSDDDDDDNNDIDEDMDDVDPPSPTQGLPVASMVLPPAPSVDSKPLQSPLFPQAAAQQSVPLLPLRSPLWPSTFSTFSSVVVPRPQGLPPALHTVKSE